ncbi:macrolide family glycosyltransferase, partial [Streptomyces alkaliterrae]
FPTETLRVTMECAGNGRARLAPRPVSQPWLVEAVGTAEWTGVQPVPPGHVFPCLGLARELVDRGHRVTYAVTERFAATVAATGAEPLLCPETLPLDTDLAALASDPVKLTTLLFEESVAALPSLLEHYGRGGVAAPELVLHDSGAYAGVVLAHRLGVPAVQLATHMISEDWSDADGGAQSAVFTSEAARSYADRFREWLTANGMPDTGPDDLDRPRRALALVPSAMQPDADSLDPAVYSFVGAGPDGRIGRERWSRPADVERVVLVSLGSGFTRRPHVYRACVEAFGGRPGWHVVLQIGRHVSLEELGELPGNVEPHDWVPQAAVLAEADLFVTHAGMGGSQEGLAFGVPMVAVPQALDQFDNADRLCALGVARRLDNHAFTARALRRAADELLDDPAMPTRLAALRAAVRADGGPRRAADLVEREVAAARG